ncbi:PleD family two-component system response regulator [Litorivivens sp.]|uniref:response regulator n=1 Tax=Litorivivens sp. TaxID=2020868 RepID=UPI0035641BD9
MNTTPNESAAIYTALVVDDSLAERERIKVLLGRRGVNVVCVGDGEQALKCLKKPLFDIVLCDWELPCVSGLDICREVRQMPLSSRPYFVMITGRSQRVDLIAAMDAGADDFIRKPLWEEELRVRLSLASQIIAWRRVVKQAGLTDAVQQSSQ